MKTLHLAVALLVIVSLQGCGYNPLRKPVPADLSLKVDPRIVRSCEKFPELQVTALTEALVLHEYTKLSNAYTDCFNNNEAWLLLFKKELSNGK